MLSITSASAVFVMLSATCFGATSGAGATRKVFMDGVSDTEREGYLLTASVRDGVNFRFLIEISGESPIEWNNISVTVVDHGTLREVYVISVNLTPDFKSRVFTFGLVCDSEIISQMDNHPEAGRIRYTVVGGGLNGECKLRKINGDGSDGVVLGSPLDASSYWVKYGMKTINAPEREFTLLFKAMVVKTAVQLSQALSPFTKVSIVAQHDQIRDPKTSVHIKQIGTQHAVIKGGFTIFEVTDSSPVQNIERFDGFLTCGDISKMSSLFTYAYRFAPMFPDCKVLILKSKDQEGFSSVVQTSYLTETSANIYIIALRVVFFSTSLASFTVDVTIYIDKSKAVTYEDSVVLSETDTESIYVYPKTNDAFIFSRLAKVDIIIPRQGAVPFVMELSVNAKSFGVLNNLLVTELHSPTEINLANIRMFRINTWDSADEKSQSLFDFWVICDEQNIAKYRNQFKDLDVINENIKYLVLSQFGSECLVYALWVPENAPVTIVSKTTSMEDLDTPAVTYLLHHNRDLKIRFGLQIKRLSLKRDDANRLDCSNCEFDIKTLNVLMKKGNLNVVDKFISERQLPSGAHNKLGYFIVNWNQFSRISKLFYMKYMKDSIQLLVENANIAVALNGIISELTFPRSDYTPLNCELLDLVVDKFWDYLDRCETDMNKKCNISLEVAKLSNSMYLLVGGSNMPSYMRKLGAIQSDSILPVPMSDWIKFHNQNGVTVCNKAIAVKKFVKNKAVARFSAGINMSEKERVQMAIGYSLTDQQENDVLTKPPDIVLEYLYENNLTHKVLWSERVVESNTMRGSKITNLYRLMSSLTPKQILSILISEFSVPYDWTDLLMNGSCIEKTTFLLFHVPSEKSLITLRMFIRDPVSGEPCTLSDLSPSIQSSIGGVQLDIMRLMKRCLNNPTGKIDVSRNCSLVRNRIWGSPLAFFAYLLNKPDRGVINGLALAKKIGSSMYELDLAFVDPSDEDVNVGTKYTQQVLHIYDKLDLSNLNVAAVKYAIEIFSDIYFSAPSAHYFGEFLRMLDYVLSVYTDCNALESCVTATSRFIADTLHNPMVSDDLIDAVVQEVNLSLPTNVGYEYFSRNWRILNPGSKKFFKEYNEFVIVLFQHDFYNRPKSTAQLNEIIEILFPKLSVENLRSILTPIANGHSQKKFDILVEGTFAQVAVLLYAELPIGWMDTNGRVVAELLVNREQSPEFENKNILNNSIAKIGLEIELLIRFCVNHQPHQYPALQFRLEQNDLSVAYWLQRFPTSKERNHNEPLLVTAFKGMLKLGESDFETQIRAPIKLIREKLAGDNNNLLIKSIRENIFAQPIRKGILEIISTLHAIARRLP